MDVSGAQKRFPLVDYSAMHGDVLEAVLSRAALVDLVPASLVSKSWNRAVSSSLRWLNTPKPWLFVHTQSIRSPHVTSTRAYDHRSRVWVHVRNESSRHVSAPLRSSHSNLLYTLSPSMLLFSFDALNVEWHHVGAPKVWRTDPIVARVGRSIIIAGGTCDFEDDPLAVEMYDVEDATWRTCESMPAILKDSSTSTWLSIAATTDKLVVTEKLTGSTYYFDPEMKSWSGPYALRPDQRMSLSIIGFSDTRLVLLGVIGDVGNVSGIKVWEVDTDSFECAEIGEMPAGLVGKLKSETFGMSSVNLCMAGGFGHIYNSSEAEEVVVFEVRGGGRCEWWSFKNTAAGEGTGRMERVVFTSSEVGVGDLLRAVQSKKGTFNVTT
ncbi:hypothetical protein DM860_006961 [Cuscuta australis]|uniref:F-box domain-containing protein n=1 Tax=Cuscuta australis TaxID=267555 RepID=A0A328E9K4_9ASTE|nr:hypothetical protein DM860_006961 [Cuscuta australis]